MGFDGMLSRSPAGRFPGWANDRVDVAAKWVHATKAGYPSALEGELRD